MSVFEETVGSGAKRLGLELADEQIVKLAEYKNLVLEWNGKMNLTAITDERDFAVKHILDSLSLLTVCGFEGARVVDVGTGAGFPGIPLSVCCGAEIVLIDSLNKRVRFLNEVIEILRIENISAVHIRVEDAGRRKEYRETFDFAVSRAIAPMPALMEFCLPLVRLSGTCIAMKGNNYRAEAEAAARAIKLLGGGELEIKTLELPPDDISRSLLITKKVRPTPAIYPRTYANMTKKPL